MKFDRDKTIQTLKDLPDIVAAYVENIPAELFDRRRSDDAWTIREHLYHIVAVQEMLYGRLLTMKTENLPVIKPFDPDKDGDKTPRFKSVAEALTVYRTIRDKQLGLIGTMTEADFARSATHPEYMQYGIPVVLNHMIFHEYWHAYRMEELWLTRDEFYE